jgi:hypothetical protein
MAQRNLADVLPMPRARSRWATTIQQAMHTTTGYLNICVIRQRKTICGSLKYSSQADYFCVTLFSWFQVRSTSFTMSFSVSATLYEAKPKPVVEPRRLHGAGLCVRVGASGCVCVYVCVCVCVNERTLMRVASPIPNSNPTCAGATRLVHK